MAQSHRPAKVVTPTVLKLSQSDEIIANSDRQSTCSMKGDLITVEVKSSLGFEGESAL